MRHDRSLRLVRLGPMLLGVAVAACGSSNAAGPRAPGDTVPASSAAPATAAGPARLRKLVGPGAKPSLFGAAAKLKIGMHYDEAKAAAPDLAGAAPYHVPGFDDVQMKARSDAYGRLGAIVVTLHKATALADLMAVWGEPVKGYSESDKSTLYWWFDPASHLRATLQDGAADADTSSLVLDEYFPVAELIGTAKDRLGLEKEPIVAMPIDRAAQVYAAYMPSVPGDSRPQKVCDFGRGIFVVPPVEYDDTFTRVRLGCRDHDSAIGSFEVIIRYANHVALRDEIVQLLKQKFGEPVPKPGGALEFSSPGRRVHFHDSSGDKVDMKEVTLQVRAGEP